MFSTPRCPGFSPITSRRQFLSQFGMGLGALALSEMGLPRPALAESGVLQAVHHPPKAKKVIFLFQAGGPSQMDTFDYKPELIAQHGKELPDEVRQGQRLTSMSGNQASLPMVGSPFPFSQHGECGAWVSDLFPHTAEVVDELCFIKSLYTEAINHGPAVTHVQTGSQLPGRPSIGAWLSYGLGTENDNLPAFVVMITNGKGGQPLASRLWGNGFLPSRHQGVEFRAGDEPVLYINNPNGLTSQSKRQMLDALGQLHQLQLEQVPDPLIETRIAQYELAFRMQTAIPEATDLTQESQHTFELYGDDAKTPGTFAANCLLARRLVERDVRFVQLYHQGWDHHGGLPGGIKRQAQETDQASAALVKDLKQRGLLDETLVIWGGEFGRTNYCQGKLSDNFGRDHHPRCFSIWMAGGGIKGGMSYGETDPLCYNIAENPMHLHDFQATLMHLLGIDHELLTYKYQGRRFRLTDVHGHVVQDILA